MGIRMLSTALTPAQAVRVHGWLSPSRRLTWLTVVSRKDLTFCRLYEALSGGMVEATSVRGEGSLDSLYRLQPSFHEWVSAGKVCLVDCEIMHTRWSVDPLLDFGGSIRIGEVLQSNLSHAAMKGCSMTVDRLIEVGMTPDVMTLFHFGLEEWLALGLRREHVDRMTHAQVESVFGLTKNVLEASLGRAGCV